jgi:hypothetical protein
MKLYDLPQRQGVKIYGLEPDGDKEGVIIFDHLDGAYSYCWVEGAEDKLVHLSASTPLVKDGDGYRVAEQGGVSVNYPQWLAEILEATQDNIAKRADFPMGSVDLTQAAQAIQARFERALEAQGDPYYIPQALEDWNEPK